ncbi:MAG: hypothetical protein CVU38_14655, partial [Chloroflexi bacterium HGW-Chloroflexi-1]
LSAAPWGDGEVSTYDVLGRDGALAGSATWRWRKTSEGWSQSYELDLSGRQDRGEVIMAADLLPINSWRELSGTRFETTYSADSVTIKTTAPDGKVTTRELKCPADGVDNDQSLQLQRALPMAEGYATRYTDVIPTSGMTAPVKFSVVGTEEVTAPAGTFPAWRVVMDFGSGQHDGWYAQEAPHLMIKYRNRASGAEFHLRSWQPATGQAAQGDQATPVVVAPAADSVPPLNVPFLIAAVLVQYPLMLIFPVLLGWWIRRRYGVSWGIFGAGALTFVASQVAHLPLNWALGLLGGGRGVALWSLTLMALVAGLSAGVCEEGARWIILRFFLKRARGWREALQFGAGHGAVEAIIFGALALLSLVSMLAARTLDLAAFGLPGAPAEQARAAVAAYWATPWYMSAMAGLERVFAITFHIAMAVLVMRAVVRNRIGYLLAAIAAHAALDFVAVWGAQRLGVIWVEVSVAVIALAALWLIIKLKETPSAEAEPLPAAGPAPTAADLAPRTLSAEELARRADASRYE